MIRVLIGIDSNIYAKILYAVAMFIPLINLIVILILNRKVTATLQAAGHKVGIFGVKREK